jgi:hypothetical protein
MSTFFNEEMHLMFATYHGFLQSITEYDPQEKAHRCHRFSDKSIGRQARAQQPRFERLY